VVSTNAAGRGGSQGTVVEELEEEGEDVEARKNQGTGKTRKPLSSRKAPEAADSHAVVGDWIRRVMPDLNPIVAQLDDTIRKTLPGLQYAVKWKKAYYGLPEQGWIIEMVAYDVSVNVVFFGGTDFDDPPPLGSDGRSRYVKLKTLEEAQSPLLREWIKAAGRVRGWR
jgi:hypothetical protein